MADIVVNNEYVKANTRKDKRPTSGLSPKRERVLIFVSDSSTALRKCDSTGRMTKGDLSNKVDNIGQPWLEARYVHEVLGDDAQLARKGSGRARKDVQSTLSKHAHRHRRAVGRELNFWTMGMHSRTHLPWCNVQGPHGFHGARRQENLARRRFLSRSRKGEPESEIGFVKVIGKGASSCIPCCDVQAIRKPVIANANGDTMHGKAELYDSFHASEHGQNGQVFTTFIHATLNMSRAEFLAEKMAIAVQPLLKRLKHVEPERGSNPVVTTEVTEEDRIWEMPDVAKDVPAYGPRTSVKSIAQHINDIVAQDVDGKVTYEPPHTVALADEGDYQVFIDQSALQGAATMGDTPVREYFYSGQKHRMLPLDPEAIVGDTEIKFNHGDLKFLSLLLRGHEVELHGLKFDKRCWTDVGKLLDRFNYCRQRCWGIRQLLRATKADNKGSIGLLGIDVPMKETIGPPLFPVRMRVSQGHNDHIVEDEDTDLFL
ncbi:unnamed protein product [Symbiodinium necroappetens]|uniref:Uncharacterized protein n=1 Tax=Symbiodinium necroappetens TaxID=1628268 RepID=A0A813A957_9DINO|nr:unnamed protein product [Symbiodinium necroappetens]